MESSERQSYVMEWFDPLYVSLGCHTFTGTVEELVRGDCWTTESGPAVVVESRANMGVCAFSNEILDQIMQSIQERPDIVGSVIELVETAAILHTIDFDADTRDAIIERTTLSRRRIASER